MDPLRGLRNAEASGSNNAAAGNPVRKARKKAKPSTQSNTKNGPIPAPYLATAPSPVSTLTQARIDELAAVRSNMVLPSTFTRPTIHTSSSSPGPSRPAEPQVRRKKYAAGLVAPPAIMPGGSTALPRIQGTGVNATQNPRRRSADRTGVGGQAANGPIVVTTTPRNGLGNRQRSEERLREMGQVNASVMSLGQLGHIMEVDPPATATAPISVQPAEDTQSGRRRRRVVRGETGLTRRPTVSTREEGMALGLARGASMRRRNVWDDVPESSDPPPAFPFPTVSSSRSPPAFETNNAQLPNQPAPTDRNNEGNRPRSPPPSFEQAIGLVPHPATVLPSPQPAPAVEAGPAEVNHSSRPILSLQTNLPGPSTPQPPCSASPVSQYESAASSPVPSEAAVTEETTEETLTEAEREDRRMWNADLLAGYSLGERVRRESERRKARLADDIDGSTSVEQESSTNMEQESSTNMLNRPGGPQPVTESGKAEAPAGNERAVPPAGPEEPEATTLTGDPILSSAVSTQELADQADAVPATTVGLPSSQELPAISKSDDDTAQVEDIPVIHPPIPSTPPRSPVPRPSTPAAQTFVLPPVVVSPFQPTPGFGKSQATYEPGSPTQASGKQTFAPQSLRAGTPVAKQAQSDEVSQSGAESDQVVSYSPPTRKLTRGKAIRRSSTSPKVTPVRAESVRSKRTTEPQKPLFSSPGYTAKELELLPQNERLGHHHRQSAPNVLDGTSGIDTLDGQEAARPLRERMKSTPNIHMKTEDEPSGSGGLPPHREAALRRRESALGRMERKNVSLATMPTAIQEDKLEPSLSSPIGRKPVQSPVNGPLIDLNEPWPVSVSHSPPSDLHTLAATTAELLQLLEDQPVAESSAQGAAKAAALQAMKDMLNQQATATVSPKASVSSDPSNVAPKKKAPPPPPPLRLKRSTGSLARKPSVLMSADSPIIPRIINPPSVSDKSETKGKPATIPTRRPPPPPPVDIPASSSLAPPLPPRPAPPEFSTRPPLDDRRWSAVSGTNSSVSERDGSVISPPIPEYGPRSRPRTSLAVRPRGPRPPPPMHMRSWSKIVEDIPVDPPMRPNNERTMSNPTLVVDTRVPSPPRSISAVDLRSPTSQPRSPEYTDLDVYVARLEGSGREYEGFAHITSFLGPAKNPAASPAALATLLPAPILVDSRRTNAAGKIKLKLSLLGVRVTKCPICLSQFKGGDKGVMLPICGHVAHEGCARRWFRENRNCFVCRVPLAEEE